MFSAGKDGTISAKVDDGVRTLIGSLADQLRELLLVDDADDLRRLYPTAYPDDAERQAEFQSIVQFAAFRDHV